MKKILYVALFIGLMAACKSDSKSKSSPDKTASGKLDLKGTISGLDTGLLEVMYTGKEDKTADTIKIKDGKFTFSVDLKEPSLMMMRLAGTQGAELTFFADPGDVKITATKDSFMMAKVEGGENQKAFAQSSDSVKKIMEPGKALYDSFMMAQSRQDQAAAMRIEQQYMELQKKVRDFAVRYATNNRDKVVAAYYGLMYLGDGSQPNELKALYDTLTPGVKNTFFGKQMGDMVASVAATAEGATPPDFSLNSPDGKPISLASFKGKYTLIDFWASWCMPCRQENPHVVAAYKAYSSKGFDIIGVSLDRNKEEWVKGIKEDNLTWAQVWDEKSEVANKYGIQSIPANFLLDKEGKIIAKNLRGADLDAKLKELMP